MSAELVVDDPRPSLGLAFLAEHLRSDPWQRLAGCEATLTADCAVARAVSAEEALRPQPWLTITDCRRRRRTWPDITDPLLLRCVRDAGYRLLTLGERRVLEETA